MEQDKPSWNQSQGRAGEALAKMFLERQGFKIVTERYRTRLGEIDLVAQKGNTLLFVEVKARSGPDFGDPLEAITPKKLGHLKRAVSGFLLENPEYQQDYFWELAAIAVRNYDAESEIEMIRILP